MKTDTDTEAVDEQVENEKAPTEVLRNQDKNENNDNSATDTATEKDHEENKNTATDVVKDHEDNKNTATDVVKDHEDNKNTATDVVKDHGENKNTGIEDSKEGSVTSGAGTSSGSNDDDIIPSPSLSPQSVSPSWSTFWPQMILSRIVIAHEVAIYRRATALSIAVILVALLSCSASQLRMQLAYPHTHVYTKFIFYMIGTCIALEVISGALYIFLTRHDLPDRIVENVHTALIFCLFLISVISIFIISFTADDSICKILRKDKLRTFQHHHRLQAAESPPSNLSAAINPKTTSSLRS